jgi:hypothetical protein
MLIARDMVLVNEQSIKQPEHFAAVCDGCCMKTGFEVELT